MKASSRTALISICAIVTFVAGLGSGLALGSRKPTPAKGGSASGVTPRSHRPPDPTPRVEIIEKADAKSAESTPDPMAAARGLWEMMVSTDPDGPSQTDRRSRLRKLGPEMAEYFIRKFRESKDARERQIALDLAIGCGGPKAAALIEELISAPSTGKLDVDRINLKAFLLGNGLSRRPRELPLSESLLARTRALQSSSSPEDRGLAVSILGYDDPARANPALMTVLQSDPDPWVRQTSICVLGRIGDEAVMKYLGANRDKLAQDMVALYKPRPSPDGGEVMLLSRHYFDTAINDAIAELVERLRSK
jgi:hypothetical protein